MHTYKLSNTGASSYTSAISGVTRHYPASVRVKRIDGGKGRGVTIAAVYPLSYAPVTYVKKHPRSLYTLDLREQMARAGMSEEEIDNLLK